MSLTYPNGGDYTYPYSYGYTCGICGWWIAHGTPHYCTPAAAMPPTWTCGGCGQLVAGFHICPGVGNVQVWTNLTAAPEPEPAKAPETPLAGLAAKFAGLVTQAQEWLAERKL